MSEKPLTHLDASGTAAMVDVSEKATTRREAHARGRVIMAASTLRSLRAGNTKKGDVLGVSRIAGILGAKRTPELIPLCHGLNLDHIAVRFALVDAPPSVVVSAVARTAGRTGVEMEALLAVTTACAAVYDMLKGIDKQLVISDVHVFLKTGGRSGEHHFEHTIDGFDEAQADWQ